MAFYSGFFNSKGLDRTYTAEDFTAYLSSIICNGILDTYGQNFKLTPASSGIGVAIGTATYDAEVDKDFRSLVKRADASMYENKKACKA